MGNFLSYTVIFLSLYYSVTLPISALYDGVETLLVKHREFTKLGKAQIRLIIKGKMEFNRDMMQVLY